MSNKQTTKNRNTINKLAIKNNHFTKTNSFTKIDSFPKTKFLLVPSYWKNIIYTLALFFAVLPIIFNFIRKEPLFNGAETYAYLSILHLQNVPLYFLSLLPLLLMFGTIYCLINLAKKFNLSTELTFYSFIFFIISPTFINAYSTISTTALFLFFISSGFTLFYNLSSNLSSDYKFLLKKDISTISQILSTTLFIIPFLLASLLDWISAILIILILLYFFIKSASNNPTVKKITTDKKNTFKSKEFINSKIFILIALFLILLLHLLVLNRPFSIGPFHEEQFFSDLISDLGGVSGLSFFTLFLAVIGLGSSWNSFNKKKNILFALILLLITIILYINSTETILYLTLVLVFFAARGFLILLNRKWELSYLKAFTIFLLFLSLFFSTTTYLQRNYHFEPTSSEKEVLLWAKENIPSESIIFSEAVNAPLINYFSQRKAFFSLNENDKLKEATTINIFNSTYTSQTFPLLESNELSIIYLTPQIKEKYPAQQGLLFLLKNERFKML
ncbi:hypothetical protein HYU21_02415, partial [Candidatus Woesearchaeota archaeon]|nr:hypothetical protein [Candidatus Woesearchaeota archaeon]